MFLILSSTHMTAMIRVQFREMKPEPNHGFYLLKPTWNHMWSGSGPDLVKPETKSSLVAITDLKSQKRVNYAATTRKWDLKPIMLQWHFISESTSIKKANSKSCQKLASIQEEALIEHMNKLTDQV